MARRVRGKEILPQWGNGPLTVSRSALLSRGSDRKFRQMIHALVSYANSVLGARNAFASLLGISGIQYEILMVVYRLHGAEACTATEVAQQVHRSVGFTTIELNKLTTQGFIEKKVDFRDRRRVLLRVTASANLRLDDIAPVQRQLNDALFHSLTASEFNALCKLYDKLPVCGEHALALASKIVSEQRGPTRVATCR